MPCIPSARVITILYPEAKATIVTEFVNKEISSLTTKTMKVACRLRREAAVLKLTGVDATCRHVEECVGVVSGSSLARRSLW